MEVFQLVRVSTIELATLEQLFQTLSTLSVSLLCLHNSQRFRTYRLFTVTLKSLSRKKSSKIIFTIYTRLKIFKFH